MTWAVADSLVGMRAAKELKAGSDTVTGAGKKINANAIAALKKAGVAVGRSRRRRARRGLRRDRRRRSVDR